jgi:hypothetical protein
VLFCYIDPDSYDADLRSKCNCGGACVCDYFSLDPIVVDAAGSTAAVVVSAKYLSGILTTDGKDEKDVEARIKKASGSFGGLRK